jgi:hypothetical protein
MSLNSNQQLSRDVVSAIEEWTPSEAYGHESKFQNELQEYLDRRLNANNGMIIGGNEEIVVEREHGNANGDVVVNGEIGIEMKRDLSNSQTNTLRGQIEEYQKEYTHVIVVACGIDDMDGWRKLKNDYENQSGVGMDFDSAPVKFIHKQKSNYGEEDSAADYETTTGDSLQEGEGVEEIAKALEDGVKGYKSLTGDGPMDTGEATVALTKGVLVVGFILAVVIFVLINFIL